MSTLYEWRAKDQHLYSQQWGMGMRRKNQTRQSCHLPHHPLKALSTPWAPGERPWNITSVQRMLVFFLSLSLWFPMSQSLRRNNWWGLARGGSILTLLQLQWERTLNCSTRWGSRCPAPCSWGFPISLRKGRTYLSTIGSNGFHCLLFRDNLRLVGWFVVLLKEPGTLRSPFWTFYKRAFKTQQTLKTLILEHRES